MESDEIQAYRDLKDSGVSLQKRNQIRFNSGSESVDHLIAKAIVGYIGHKNDYRVSSEVEVPNGEIDIVLWGHKERLSYAVEVETNPEDQTIQDKLETYIYQTNIDDMIVINPEIVGNVEQITQTIKTELGLEHE